MAFFFTKTVRNVIIIVALFNLLNYYLKWKSYTILDKDFKTAATGAVDKNALTSVSRFTGEMRKMYKNRIPSSTPWVPFTLGSLHLRSQFVFASPFEYVVVFAAPADTVGRTGFHWSNSTCTVLTGSVHRFSDSYNNIVKESYTDGNNFRQGQFESYIYQITEGTHLTCYGRGFVPASALSVSMGALSSGDVMALFRIYYTYGKAVMENLVLHLTDTFTWAKQQAISKLEL